MGDDDSTFVTSFDPVVITIHVGRSEAPIKFLKCDRCKGILFDDQNDVQVHADFHASVGH